MNKITKTNTKIPRKPDQVLLRKIGLLIHKSLYEANKPVEWLSFKSGVARSSIREIIAGRSNSRILTLNSIAVALGYESIIELLDELNHGSKD